MDKSPRLISIYVMLRDYATHYVGFLTPDCAHLDIFPYMHIYAITLCL